MEKINKLQAADKISGPSRDGGNRRWEDLGSDLLVAIFSRIGVEDLIAGLPYVCSSWRCAVRDPVCWRVLDFRSWDTISHRLGCRRDEAVDFADLFNFAISRSAGVIDCVYFPRFSDEIDLEYVANRCPMLQYFSMENPTVSKSAFRKTISKFKFLKGMAVHENLLCRHVLQHFNQCSSNFIELKVFSDTMDKQMASIICECLPHLQKLEITESIILSSLLDRLKELEFLDVSGYGISGITNEVFEKDLIISLAKGQNMEEAMQVWDSMKEKELFPDSQTYAEVIRGFLRFGSPADAMNIYEDMKKCPDPPEELLFRVLLKGLVAHPLLRNRVKQDFIELFPERHIYDPLEETFGMQ